MNIRTKVLVAFLAGTLTVWGVQSVRDFVVEVHTRLGAIEGYLAGQKMMRQMQQQGTQPQSHRERSHKGEISQPQQWKV
jgi:hypothetical protein